MVEPDFKVDNNIFIVCNGFHCERCRGSGNMPSLKQVGMHVVSEFNLIDGSTEIVVYCKPMYGRSRELLNLNVTSWDMKALGIQKMILKSNGGSAAALSCSPC